MFTGKPNPFILGVAGGSASGKTTFADRFVKVSPAANPQVLVLDAYYHPQSDLTLEERAKQNYDHPEAFDFELLIEHLTLIRQGQSVDVPVYDFANHTRSLRTVKITPAELVVVEGILTFHHEQVRRLFDFKIFIDAPAELRLARRLERDTRERGRTSASVLSQWKGSVDPMHNMFCEPCRDAADLVLRGDQEFTDDLLKGVLRKLETNKKTS